MNSPELSSAQIHKLAEAARRYLASNNPELCVSRYCEAYRLVAEQISAEDFARMMLAMAPVVCLGVLETIGSWPSSEPELAALQRSFR